MYINHTFSNRLDAKKSFKCIEISLSDQSQVQRPSLKFVSGPMRAQLVLCFALIGPDTNFREGLFTI